MITGWTGVAGLVVAMAAISSGCAGASDSDTVVVMAASSLASAVDQIDESLADDDTAPSLRLIVAGSQNLVAQLGDGAEADILITADVETMNKADADGLIAAQHGSIALNRLVIAVAPGNPGGIRRFEDLADQNLLIGVCAPVVPCGRLAAESAAALGINVAADTEEANVRSLAQKISGGELDAGLIYRTDATRLGLETVDEDRLARFVNEYRIGTVDPDPTEAVRQTLDLLRSNAVGEILVAEGFELP